MLDRDDPASAGALATENAGSERGAQAAAETAGAVAVSERSQEASGLAPGPGDPTARTMVPEWLLVRAAEQLHVLGHVVRLQLVEELAAGARSPQELAAELAISQQGVSKHLQALYATGVVQRRRDGTRVLYELADAEIVGLLDRLAARVTRQLRKLSSMADGDGSGVPG